MSEFRNNILYCIAKNHDTINSSLSLRRECDAVKYLKIGYTHGINIPYRKYVILFIVFIFLDLHFSILKAKYPLNLF